MSGRDHVCGGPGRRGLLTVTTPSVTLSDVRKTRLAARACPLGRVTGARPGVEVTVGLVGPLWIGPADTHTVVTRRGGRRLPHVLASPPETVGPVRVGAEGRPDVTFQPLPGVWSTPTLFPFPDKPGSRVPRPLTHPCRHTVVDQQDVSHYTVTGRDLSVLIGQRTLLPSTKD